MQDFDFEVFSRPEKEGGTFLTSHEFYPSKEALDESLVGMDSFMPEQFDQLDALLAGLAADTGTP